MDAQMNAGELTRHRKMQGVTDEEWEALLKEAHGQDAPILEFIRAAIFDPGRPWQNRNSK